MHLVWHAASSGRSIRLRHCGSGSRLTPRPISRDWLSASMTRRLPAVPGTCGSWSVLSTTRAPGPNPECVSWRPTGSGGEAYRTSPLDDQWELYDLTADPIEERQPLDGSGSARPAPAPADAAQRSPGQFGPGAKPAVALRISPPTERHHVGSRPGWRVCCTGADGAAAGR